MGWVLKISICPEIMSTELSALNFEFLNENFHTKKKFSDSPVLKYGHGVNGPSFVID